MKLGVLLFPQPGLSAQGERLHVQGVASRWPRGDEVTDGLRYVQYDKGTLIERVRRTIEEAGLCASRGVADPLQAIVEVQGPQRPAHLRGEHLDLHLRSQPFRGSSWCTAAPPSPH